MKALYVILLSTMIAVGNCQKENNNSDKALLPIALFAMSNQNTQSITNGTVSVSYVLKDRTGNVLSNMDVTITGDVPNTSIRAAFKKGSKTNSGGGVVIEYNYHNQTPITYTVEVTTPSGEKAASFTTTTNPTNPSTVKTENVSGASVEVKEVVVKNTGGQTVATNTTPIEVKDTNPPTALSSNPAKDATGVTLNQSITVTFNEPVQTTTVNSTSFVVKQGTTVVSGTVTLSGLVATFTPKVSWSSNTTYTITLTSGILDTFGNAMVESSWVFKTEVLQWTKQLGVTSKITSGFGITTDFNGNIYVTGNTGGGLDGNTLIGNNDAFVIKYDSNGNKQWMKQTGVASNDTVGYGITIDSNGNIYITGRTRGGLDGNTLTGFEDMFVIKYDSNGNKQWTKLMGVASKGTYGNSIITDSNGNIYITGYTGNLSTGPADAFVTKYDNNGNLQWTKLMGDISKRTCSYGITIDSNRNIYITGYTEGSLDGNSLVGTRDVFLLKYDNNGNKQWTKQIGVASKITQGTRVTVFGENIYVTGFTDSGLDGNILTGTEDAFVIKYDSSGSKQWTKQIGSTSKHTSGMGITIDSGGYIYITGVTQGGLDGNTLIGLMDAFVTKYDSNGNKQWTKQTGVTSKNTWSTGIANFGGNIYIAGYTDGGFDGNTLTGFYDVFITNKLNQ